MRIQSWRKSSFSVNNGNCVEVGRAHAAASGVAVRDSKLDTTGDFPCLVVPTAEWNALVAGVSSDVLTAAG